MYLNFKNTKYKIYIFRNETNVMLILYLIEITYYTILYINNELNFQNYNC